jgi:hypothetical protein
MLEIFLAWDYIRGMNAPGFGDLNARSAAGKNAFSYVLFLNIKTARENTSKKRLRKKVEILMR